MCVYIYTNPYCNSEQVSNTLRFVSAAHNDIGAVGGRALADAYEANRAMLNLNLSFNPAVAYKDLTAVLYIYIYIYVCAYSQTVHIQRGH